MRDMREERLEIERERYEMRESDERDERVVCSINANRKQM